MHRVLELMDCDEAVDATDDQGSQKFLVIVRNRELCSIRITWDLMGLST